MNKSTYKEWLEQKQEAAIEFRSLTPKRREMANTMYKILKTQHVGKGNKICADALADKMSEELCRKITRGHVSECARLFREYGNFPGLQSCNGGYYVDESYAAMVRTLRFVYSKSLQIESTALNIRNVINRIHGEGAIPEDMREWLNQLEYAEWCEDNGFEPVSL